MKSKIEHLLDDIFSNNFNLSNANWSIISDMVKIMSVKKNTIIRPSNTYEKHLFYLQKGAAESTILKKNKLICIDICVTGEFFGDYQALHMKTKKCTHFLFLSLLLAWSCKDHRNKPDDDPIISRIHINQEIEFSDHIAIAALCSITYTKLYRLA